MNDKYAYAKYESMLNFSYKIIEYLLLLPEAEIIWKLLKYNDVDAYDKPNLTQGEKAELIYKGQPDQTNYNVFFDYMMDDAEDQMRTLLRIYPAEVYPKNRTVGICTINIEVFAHSKINHLSNYTTRVDTIVQKLLEILNGADIGGVGVLYFDSQACSYNKIQVIGQKPYKGKLIKMAINIG